MNTFQVNFVEIYLFISSLSPSFAHTHLDTRASFVVKGSSEHFVTVSVCYRHSCNRIGTQSFLHSPIYMLFVAVLLPLSLWVVIFSVHDFSRFGIHQRFRERGSWCRAMHTQRREREPNRREIEEVWRESNTNDTNVYLFGYENVWLRLALYAGNLHAKASVCAVCLALTSFVGWQHYVLAETLITHNRMEKINGLNTELIYETY